VPLLGPASVGGAVGGGADGMGEAAVAIDVVGAGAAHAAPDGGEASGCRVDLEAVVGDAGVEVAEPVVHVAPGVQAAAARLGGIRGVVVRASEVGGAVEAPGPAEPAGEHADGAVVTEGQAHVV